MSSQVFQFNCSGCGQSIEATSEQVGMPAECPVCNLAFVIPAPQALPSHSAPTVSSHNRNPLLLPLVCLASVLLVILIGGFVYALQRNTLSTTRNEVKLSTPPGPLNGSTIPSTQQRISAETRTRLLNFTEKASKLSVLTEQGVKIAAFNEQLAEVKSAWSTIIVGGWPDKLTGEKENVESAINGWNLAKEIWERKNKAFSDPPEKVEFMADASKLYGARLRTYTQTLALHTGEQKFQRQLEMLDLEVNKKSGLRLLDIDNSISLCMSCATFSLVKAKEGLQSKLNE